MDSYTPVTLKYEIHEVSSYVSEFPAHKILENKPNDYGSRWCSETNTYPQFITLKLAPCLLNTITFGKYEKTNLCNTRKFEIHGGWEPDGMVKLYEGRLRNDAIPETFQLRTMVGQRPFPVRFLKIAPLQTWGSSFNFCIWYVELRGIEEESALRPFINTLDTCRQETTLRMCLKLFRRMGLQECFNVLQRSVDIQLEHPVITELYDTIVNKGNYEKAEYLVQHAIGNGFAEEFLCSQPYIPVWSQITPQCPMGSSGVCPGMRGGHQMVLDPCSRTIYLFGGWDGTKDLSDFWKYDIVKSEWQLIAFNTEDQGGPSPRSCHKMVLDIDEQIILTLGRYVDQNSKTNDSLKSELHMYDIKRKRWTEISSDTYLDGGPRLVFDHQMAIDIQKKMMFVFGGRVIEKKGSELAEGSWLSGLYFYKMQTNSWKRVQPDVRATRLKDHSFKPRVGHCMIFHPDKRLLYMFGGHYNKEPIKDMIAYDVDNESYQILADADAGDTLPVGLTQRATVDLERNEIYVYFGVAKDREKPDDVLQNTIWIFDVNSSKWSVCPSRSPASLHPEPTARYAHQLVYDPVEKLHFLFGGNPARSTNVSKLRLDDFWKLQLLRPTAPELMRRVRNLLWRQKFMELCWSDPVVAVNFLQVNLAGGIDLNDPQEVEEFHQLPSYLFCNDIDTCGIRLGLKASSIHDKRTEVFSKLCDFFPDAMVPPRQNLMDLVQL